MFNIWVIGEDIEDNPTVNFPPGDIVPFPRHSLKRLTKFNTLFQDGRF